MFCCKILNSLSNIGRNVDSLQRLRPGPVNAIEDSHWSQDMIHFCPLRGVSYQGFDLFRDFDCSSFSKEVTN